MDVELNYQEIVASLEQRIKEETAAEAEMLALQSKILEAQELVRKLTREKNQIDLGRRDRRNEIRHLESQKIKAKRFEEAKANRDRLIEEYNRQAKALHEETQDAIWRTGFNLNGNLIKAYPHQIEGGARLAVAQRGILGDKRGLGKTLTSLIYLDMVKARKVLIIAPNDVVPQFEDEIRMWASQRRIMSFAGLNMAQRGIIYPMLKMLDSFIITLNYEAWRRDKSIIDDLIAAGIDTILLDEAHRAKSSSKITAKGIFQVAFSRNWCPAENEIKPTEPWFTTDGYNDVEPLYARHCPDCNEPLEPSVANVVSMTGTPILNKPQELFTMLHLVDPKRFPSEKVFLDDYCYPVAAGKWRFSPGGEKKLIASMSEFFVQRNRDDAGIHIPPPKITVHYLDKDPVNYPRQYKAYKDLTERAAMTLEDGTQVNMLYILEIMLRERQIISWPKDVTLKLRDDEGEVIDILKFDVDESQKLDAAVELAAELCEEGERFIFFSKFKLPLYEAKRRLEKMGHSVTTATGDDPTRHRENVRYDFDLKTAPKNPNWLGVFATFDAFATGINLNAARHAIFLDDEWNPGMEDQAIGRIDRLNSTDQAQVHIFRVKHTIDEFMEALIEEKRKLTEGLEGGLNAADLLKHLREQ